MELFRNKKKLFIIYLMIASFAGISNFMGPANLFVMASIGLSLLVVLFGDKMATLYLMIALIPFYNSLNINGVSAGFVIPLFAIGKLLTFPSRNEKSHLVISMILFLSVWFFHDIQYQTFAMTIFSLLVPCFVFLFVLTKDWHEYDGYYAMWLVIATTLIAMVCVFMVQGGSLESFIYTSYAGEMRLGEANTDDGQRNQLGGAMGFPIYTLTIVSLLIQMLMTRRFRLWQKASCLALIIGSFFITFLTVSRVYILGLATMALLLICHVMRSKSKSAIFGVLLGCSVLFLIASNYLTNYMDIVFNNYLGRMENDGEQGGTGIRGIIYKDCYEYLLNNVECLLIGKGNGAYPLIGAQLHRPFSMSAHNMIIDGLMSFGIIGSVFIFVVYKNIYKKDRNNYGMTWTIFRIMPLLCIFMMYQTGSPFLQDKTYPFLMFLVLNIIHCTDNSEYDPRWCTENDYEYKII